MQDFYYIVGSIISVCSILTVVIQITKMMFYSKTEGSILSTKIDSILHTLDEIKEHYK